MKILDSNILAAVAVIRDAISMSMSPSSSSSAAAAVAAAAH